MSHKEDARSFVFAALALLMTGAVVRMLLGAPPVRELLQFAGTVGAAFVAVLFFRHIPWDRLPKSTGRFWGILGYGTILGLGVLVMLIPYHPMAVAPIIAAVLPTLALLPLLCFTEGRGTPGFIVVLIGVLAAAAVTWLMGFVAASVIVCLVGISVVLIRRRRFGEGDERWIGHLVFAGIVLVGLWLLLMSELTKPWLNAWLQSVFVPSVTAEGEEFQNYLSHVFFKFAQPFGTSTIREIQVFHNPDQFMAVEKLLPDPGSRLVLSSTFYHWGLVPTFVILFPMVMLPVNGCFLAHAQRGFQRCNSLTVSLLLGLPIFFFIFQNLGLSVLMIDFCPLFSCGFLQNFVYLLLVLAAAGHIFPPVKGRSCSSARTADRKSGLPASRLIHCKGDHEVLIAMKKLFASGSWTTEKVEGAFSAADTFTVFSAEGTYYDIRLAVRSLSLDCSQAALLAALVEYTEAVPFQDEADDLEDMIWANFSGEKCPRLHVTCAHSGELCRDPMGTWRVTVAMGSAPLLPKAESEQVDTADMVS